MISRPENLNVWVRTQTYIETLKTENETFEGHFKVWVKFEFEAQTFGFFVGTLIDSDSVWSNDLTYLILYDSLYCIHE